MCRSAAAAGAESPGMKSIRALKQQRMLARVLWRGEPPRSAGTLCAACILSTDLRTEFSIEPCLEAVLVLQPAPGNEAPEGRGALGR